jgi:lipoprotein-anchoring transpeptidase ErfK/SrfK
MGALAVTLAAAAALLGSHAPGYLAVSPAPGRALTLYDRPGGRVVAQLTRSVFGGPVVAGVVRRSGDWDAVTTEALPNGTLGWVDTRAGVRVARVHDSIRVSLAARRLDLYRDGRLVRSFAVGVGAAGSPTPTGRFAVAEKIPGARYGAVYGCCILGLTAHQPRPPAGWSRSVRYFVAIHGGGGIGSAVSAGCLHLRDDELRYLMRTVPLGAPVFVGA